LLVEQAADIIKAAASSLLDIGAQAPAPASFGQTASLPSTTSVYGLATNSSVMSTDSVSSVEMQDPLGLEIVTVVQTQTVYV